MRKIKFAETNEEIRACRAVMTALRPHVGTETEFLERIKRQQKNFGFRLAFLAEEDVKAVGGVRVGEWLAGGKYLEIEDLVAREDERSKGFGGALFDWIVEFAKSENCDQLKLVSHVKRFGAHRFYLNKKMIIEAHYFSMILSKQ